MKKILLLKISLYLRTVRVAMGKKWKDQFKKKRTYFILCSWHAFDTINVLYFLKSKGIYGVSCPILYENQIVHPSVLRSSHHLSSRLVIIAKNMKNNTQRKTQVKLISIVTEVCKVY